MYVIDWNVYIALINRILFTCVFIFK